MNKYLIIGGMLVLLVIGGVVYRLKNPPATCPPTGVAREVTIIARKDKWLFEPELIELDCGDLVKATVVNEDSYDHGIAINFYGIDVRMPANSTKSFEFMADRPGDYQYFCSVPCGEGDVEINGKKEHRRHEDMIGKFHVQGMVSEVK